VPLGHLDGLVTNLRLRESVALGNEHRYGLAFSFSGAHTWIHLSALYGATAPPQERAPVSLKSASLLMKAAFRAPEELEGGGSRGNALLAPF
jgi:hypothetical protein